MWKALSLLLALSFFNNAAIAAVPTPSSFDKLLEKAWAPGTEETSKIEYLQRAVSEAEKPGGNPAQLAFALVRLGDAYSGKDNDAAIAAYKRAIEIREKIGAVETMGMARNLLRYAMVKGALESSQVMERAIKKANGDKDILTQEVYNAALQSDVTAALERALPIAERTIAPESIQFQIMQCLSSHYEELRRYAEAEAICKKMIAFADRPNNPNAKSEKMTAYSTLLNVYSDQDKEDEITAVRKKMDPFTDEAPSPEQIKATQNYYSFAETVVDQNEQLDFKKPTGKKTIVPANCN